MARRQSLTAHSETEVFAMLNRDEITSAWANQISGEEANRTRVDAGSGKDPTRPQRAQLPALPADVAIGDLEDLLNAVKARLQSSVAERMGHLPEQRAHSELNQVRTSVLECVVALDQLQETLAHELSRRQQLEMEVFDTQVALAQARAELVGTQAGERLARHLALHDSLTALPNRSFFHGRLEQALAQGQGERQPLAVLYLDLDGFKQINDEHGHDAGDQLLRIVAVRLTRAVRADDLIGRLGGDEFACLLIGLTGREQLTQLANKLVRAVSAPFKIGKARLNVRPSIGIAICPNHGSDPSVLLKNADQAMFRAKRQQTGFEFFGENG